MTLIKKRREKDKKKAVWAIVLTLLFIGLLPSNISNVSAAEALSEKNSLTRKKDTTYPTTWDNSYEVLSAYAPHDLGMFLAPDKGEVLYGKGSSYATPTGAQDRTSRTQGNLVYNGISSSMYSKTGCALKREAIVGKWDESEAKYNNFSWYSARYEAVTFWGDNLKKIENSLGQQPYWNDYWNSVRNTQNKDVAAGQETGDLQQVANAVHNPYSYLGRYSDCAGALWDGTTSNITGKPSDPSTKNVANIHPRREITNNNGYGELVPNSGSGGTPTGVQPANHRGYNTIDATLFAKVLLTIDPEVTYLLKDAEQSGYFVSARSGKTMDNGRVLKDSDYNPTKKQSELGYNKWDSGTKCVTSDTKRWVTKVEGDDPDKDQARRYCEQARWGTISEAIYALAVGPTRDKNEDQYVTSGISEGLGGFGVNSNVDKKTINNVEIDIPRTITKYATANGDYKASETSTSYAISYEQADWLTRPGNAERFKTALAYAKILVDGSWKNTEIPQVSSNTALSTKLKERAKTKDADKLQKIVNFLKYQVHFIPEVNSHTWINSADNTLQIASQEWTTNSGLQLGMGIDSYLSPLYTKSGEIFDVANKDHRLATENDGELGIYTAKSAATSGIIGASDGLPLKGDGVIPIQTLHPNYTGANKAYKERTMLYFSNLDTTGALGDSYEAYTPYMSGPAYGTPLIITGLNSSFTGNFLLDRNWNGTGALKSQSEAKRLYALEDPLTTSGYTAMSTSTIYGTSDFAPYLKLPKGFDFSFDFDIFQHRFSQGINNPFSAFLTFTGISTINVIQAIPRFIVGVMGYLTLLTTALTGGDLPYYIGVELTQGLIYRILIDADGKWQVVGILFAFLSLCAIAISTISLLFSRRKMDAKIQQGKELMWAEKMYNRFGPLSFIPVIVTYIIAWIVSLTLIAAVVSPTSKIDSPVDGSKITATSIMSVPYVASTGFDRCIVGPVGDNLLNGTKLNIETNFEKCITDPNVGTSTRVATLTFQNRVVGVNPTILSLTGYTSAEEYWKSWKGPSYALGETGLDKAPNGVVTVTGGSKPYLWQSNALAFDTVQTVDADTCPYDPQQGMFIASQGTNASEVRYGIGTCNVPWVASPGTFANSLVIRSGAILSVLMYIPVTAFVGYWSLIFGAIAFALKLVLGLTFLFILGSIILALLNFKSYKTTVRPLLYDTKTRFKTFVVGLPILMLAQLLGNLIVDILLKVCGAFGPFSLVIQAILCGVLLKMMLQYLPLKQIFKLAGALIVSLTSFKHALSLTELGQTIMHSAKVGAASFTEGNFGNAAADALKTNSIDADTSNGGGSNPTTDNDPTNPGGSAGPKMNRATPQRGGQEEPTHITPEDIKNTISNAKDKLSSDIKDAKESVSDAATAVKDKVENAVQGTKDATANVADKINSTRDKAKDLTDKAKNFTKEDAKNILTDKAVNSPKIGKALDVLARSSQKDTLAYKVATKAAGKHASKLNHLVNAKKQHTTKIQGAAAQQVWDTKRAQAEKVIRQKNIAQEKARTEQMKRASLLQKKVSQSKSVAQQAAVAKRQTASIKRAAATSRRTRRR